MTKDGILVLNDLQDLNAATAAELPLITPEDVAVDFAARDDRHLDMTVRWRRGQKPCDRFKLRIGGVIINDPLDARYSGDKPAGHVYEYTAAVPRGEPIRIAVAAIGDCAFDGAPAAAVGRTLRVNVPDDAPAREPSRDELITAAASTYAGPLTARLKPHLRHFRAHAGMPDVTASELDSAWPPPQK